ncbi:MAG: hypothetical protein OEZ16_07010 [Chromatiales bacterium]|nr:hypothetical protein [Chromatiales bacterium]
MNQGIQSFLLLIAMLALMIVLPACSPSSVRYVSQPLPLPVRPLLPAVSANELICLSDNAYFRLVERDRLRRVYAEELVAIIEATHTDAISPNALTPPE